MRSDLGDGAVVVVVPWSRGSVRGPSRRFLEPPLLFERELILGTLLLLLLLLRPPGVVIIKPSETLAVSK